VSRGLRVLVPLLNAGLDALRVVPSHLLGVTLTHPLSVNFLLTTRCNSRCTTCDSWRLKDHDRELSLADYQRLAEECRGLGVGLATIGGGEPTLRSDLPDIIRAFKAAGLEVQLTTNGLALRPELRARLQDTGLDRLTLSVDSHVAAVYARIRGVDRLPEVLATLHELLAARPAGPAVETNTVLCRENAATFLHTIDFLLARGVAQASFSAATVAEENYLFAGPKRDLLGIPDDLVARVVAGLLERKRRGLALGPSSRFIEGLAAYCADPTRVVYPCLAGYLTLDVFADGAVHGCGNLPRVGDARSASLGEIWRSRAAAANRREMAAGHCPSCYLSCKAELAIAADPRHLPRLALERLRTASP
jgi:MoaA/NifB/PqqE/SkfB family radical SAM enzyme